MKSLNAVLCSVFLGSALNVGAAVFVEDFEGGLNGWAIKDVPLGSGVYASEFVTVPPPDAELANWPTTAVKIRGGAASGPFEEDIVYQTLPGGTSFTLGSDLAFNFYADTVTANTELDAYLLGNDGVMWAYSFTADLQTGWNSYWTHIGYGNGWYRWDGLTESPSIFATSIADVAEIGLIIKYDGTGGEIFGLDDYMVIPEPGTYMILFAAAISLCITFRRKLETLPKLLRERIRS